MEVTLRFPDVSDLLRRNAVPENLRQVALREAGIAPPRPQDEKGMPLPLTQQEQEELVVGLAELYDVLLVDALIEPKLESVDDLAGVPPEDKEFIVEIFSRSRNTDALGRFLGVVPLDLFEPFRREHKCPKGCEACEAAGAAVSTRRVD